MNRNWLVTILGFSLILGGCATTSKMSKAPMPSNKLMQAQLPDFSTLGGASLNEDGVKLVVAGDDLFKVGHSYLSPAGIQKIDALAAVLLKHPADSVTVAVYTDNTGTDAKNLKVSQRRADHIKKELVKKAVSTDRITAMGKGDADPVAANDTDNGRTQNRRAVFSIAMSK